MHELALPMMGSDDGRAEDAEPALLVRRAKAGEATAFEQLLRLHERRVFLTAMRLLGSMEDAKDAAQEVFCGCTSTCGGSTTRERWPRGCTASR